MEELHLTAAHSGERIDRFLSTDLEDLSRSYIQKLLKEGAVLVNGKAVKTSYKLNAGDEILVRIPDPEPMDILPEDIPLDILYEDEDILVINKPKGMVVHPAAGHGTGTLVNALLYHCAGQLSGINGVLRPGIVHRIDKDTSGVIIVAKNDKSHINLSEQIKNHQVEKTYIALVRGVVKENQATIDMPISRSTKDRKKMAVNKNGKRAVTHFIVLKRFPKDNCTLLQVKIETGRTHQIRVHMAEIGHPLIGDTVYSSGKNPWGIEGQCLHAKSLKFKHPITEKEMYIEAPLPEYFLNLINKLEENEKIIM